MRVRRSFAFIDVSGFTALTETEGDERAVSVVSDFRSLVRGICSRRAVRIAKWLGDGAMLVGVDTKPLVSATLEMQMHTPAQPLGIRCGIAVGDVILLEGDDYIGHAVNVSARLCDAASGGQILAQAGVGDELPKWGAVLAEKSIQIRGLEHPMQVAELGFRHLEGPTMLDPVCGIPLTASVADSMTRDHLGMLVLFCSESCRDTWERRPTPAPDSQGSLRIPLIGS